jgi:hypothetical protein
MRYEFMLLAIVTIGDAFPYRPFDGGGLPDTALRDEPHLIEEWLARAPRPYNEDAWLRFSQEHPAPSACCLYFVELAHAGSATLVYIGSIFRQSARKRLRTYHLNAGLVAALQQNPSNRVNVRYGDIQADYYAMSASPKGKVGEPCTLQPDPEPLWAFPEDDQEQIIRDVEAALIFHFKPTFNTRNKRSYQGQPIHIVLSAVPWTQTSAQRSFALNPSKE